MSLPFRLLLSTPRKTKKQRLEQLPLALRSRNTHISPPLRRRPLVLRSPLMRDASLGSRPSVSGKVAEDGSQGPQSYSTLPKGDSPCSRSACSNKYVANISKRITSFLRSPALPGAAEDPAMILLAKRCSMRQKTCCAMFAVPITNLLQTQRTRFPRRAVTVHGQSATTLPCSRGMTT